MAANRVVMYWVNKAKLILSVVVCMNTKGICKNQQKQSVEFYDIADTKTPGNTRM